MDMRRPARIVVRLLGVRLNVGDRPSLERPLPFCIENLDARELVGRPHDQRAVGSIEFEKVAHADINGHAPGSADFAERAIGEGENRRADILDLEVEACCDWRSSSRYA